VAIDISSNFQRMDRRARQLEQALRLLLRPIQEIYFGLKAGSVPLTVCLLGGCVFLLMARFGLDRAVFKVMRMAVLYPSKGWLRWGYLSIGSLSGFLFWGVARAGIHIRFLVKLGRALETAGLKNRLGNLPRFIGDWAIDATTRKMRLSNASLPQCDFVRAKPGLESGLNIYIDDMKENREYGTLDLIYSHSPMPSEVEWSSDWLKSNDLVIGQTRSKLVKTRFSDVPHLLIAGQTGGGKSTFLRQLITAQFLSDPSTEFILVDLKGGLEFQMFQDLARVDVKPDINSAVATLEKFESILNARMSILKDNKCKDRDAYMQWCASKDQKPHVNIASRYVIVIDEAAEMFLAGSHASAAEIQKARYVISKIARQGRAVGVQLIIATQRPDGRSLDPQVKANLTGVVCFQMANDASSIVVLGCGRASDLPAIPGRAIWKSGAVLVEVQIPYMSPNLVEELLANHRIVTEQKPTVQQQANATVAV